LGVVLQVVLGQFRGRLASYPGDPIPESQKIRRKPKFKAHAPRRVEAGWQPQVEVQLKEGLLPHKVAGQQVWVFSNTNGATSLDQAQEQHVFEPEVNPNAGDCIFRAARLRDWAGPRPSPAAPTTPLEAARKGFSFYQMIQCEDGQWAGDYGGPHFLLPGFVIAAYITGHIDKILPGPHQRAIEAYLLNHQQEDGGWGTHVESPSTMFGSVLNYVTLRLVGAAVDSPACIEGRKFMREHGGALYAPSWAKFWLAVLGVYEWEGIAPVPPEMWLLPHWFPLHPGRFWCHCRMVYLPMCWLYARRFAFKAAADPVASSLRAELYPEGCTYSDIDWGAHVHSVADIDNYSSLLSHRCIQHQGLSAPFVDRTWHRR
ncbi:unnamed protein product, partial [Polarella glacialis]